MNLIKKASLFLFFSLFLTTISFANINTVNTDVRSNSEAINSTETLQVHLMNEDVKTLSVMDEQNFTVGGGGSDCCGTCKIEVNLLIFKISYEWCCNKCEKKEEVVQNIE